MVISPGMHPICTAAFVKCTPCGVWTPEYSLAQVLIFSRAVRMLKLVQAMVTKHGWASEYLDGGTPEVRGFWAFRLCICWLVCCVGLCMQVCY